VIPFEPMDLERVMSHDIGAFLNALFTWLATS
jgi:hypothetical protein